MTAEVLEKIVARHEMQCLELKESFNVECIETACAFTNVANVMGITTLGVGLAVEEIVRDRQEAYYRSISECDRSGDARIFVEFMLKALRDALAEVKRGVGKGVVKSVVKILDLLKQYPDITRERLAREVGLSVRGVEKNLAQLKSAGKIMRIGGRKGGHWEAVEN